MSTDSQFDHVVNATDMTEIYNQGNIAVTIKICFTEFINYQVGVPMPCMGRPAQIEQRDQDYIFYFSFDRFRNRGKKNILYKGK